MFLILLLLQLLPPLRFRALLVGQLEAQEVPPQSGLARDVDDRAANGPETRQDGFETMRRSKKSFVRSCLQCASVYICEDTDLGSPISLSSSSSSLPLYSYSVSSDEKSKM